MNDFYGNYPLGSHGRAAPVHQLHIGDSGSRGPYHNRYRRGGSQPRGRSFAEGRGSHGAGSMASRSWRGPTAARSGSSPGRERSGSSPIRERQDLRESPPVTTRDEQRTQNLDSNGELVGQGAHNSVRRDHSQEEVDGAQMHDHRACFGGERSDSPYRADRQRWSVAESPILIGGRRMYLTPQDIQQIHVGDHRIGEDMISESIGPREGTSASSGRSGRGSRSLRSNFRQEATLQGGVGHGGHFHGLAGSRRYDGNRDVVDVSSSHRPYGQDVLGHHHHHHRHEGSHGLASLSSRREWIGLDGVTSAREGEFDTESRPGSSSGDSVTPSESRGRSFSARGGKRDYHSGSNRSVGGIGASSVAGQEHQRNDMSNLPHRVQSDSAGALWKAKKSQVPQLVQELEEKLTRGTIECMICYDMVGRRSPVWSCASCYAIFHLACIRKWAHAPTSADLSISTSNHSLEGNWRCPGCQTVEFIAAKDLRYYCFCGQIENPSLDHYLTPHSCGGPCKKALDKSKTKRCNHYCTMQCHPGPCPPCAANAPSESCPCGKKTFTRRCGEQKAIASCGDVCGRQLLCGRHYCSQVCHEGPCESCKVEVKTQCFCGVKQEILSCGRVEIQGELDFEKGLFSCASPCSKMLSCGNHKCEEKCHPGQCGDCALAPSKLQTCPCGKKKLQDLVGSGSGRKSCIDAIPTCSQGCGKLLPCGLHLCRDFCHTGPCPPCRVPVEQKCRCGSTTRSVACYVSQGTEFVGEEKVGLFLCEKKCGQKKSCGRHRCNNRCCPAVGDGIRQHDERERDRDPHECMLACGKKLRCKQHFCQELCHSGHCPPCLESIFTELSCACGKTSIPPPVACGTPLPSCQQPCSFHQACGHPATHLCHFGDCPPCTVPVTKECVGNHVMLRGVPCGSRDIKCNKLCGKTRQCGLHACGRACHVGPCDTIVDESHGTVVKSAKLSCGQQCGAPRRDCAHTCVAACHPSSPCPDNRCKVMVSIACGCGRMTGDVPCDAGGSNLRATAETEMTLSRLPAPLQPLVGNEKIPLGRRKLQCDDECGKLEKRRVLADAFGVDFHGDGHTGGDGVLGSDMLAEMLRRDPQWVLSVEERFKSLLLGPKGTGGLKVHVFCAMPKEKRDVVTQLAERWSLSVCNAGREPRRFPIVHVTNKSKVPYLRLLSKTQLPTAGQQMPPAFNPAVDMEPGLVVAFFDVPREVDMSSLVLRFAGECELVWLNDKNALAIFGDAARAATALRRVDHTSAYKGAISLPGSAIHTSGRGGGAWGAPKPAARKKAVQQESSSSSWVEDAWGEDGRKSVGAWQSKGASPITTTKNPWGALDQTRAKVSEAGIKGCFVTSQPPSIAASIKEGESSAQGERARSVKSSINEGNKQIGSLKEVLRSDAVTLSNSASSSGGNASTATDNANASAATDNNDDDDWEKLLD